MKFVLKDGSVISGSIDLETEEYYLVDEDTAFGDIVVVYKNEVREIK